MNVNINANTAAAVENADGTGNVPVNADNSNAFHGGDGERSKEASSTLTINESALKDSDDRACNKDPTVATDGADDGKEIAEEQPRQETLITNDDEEPEAEGAAVTTTTVTVSRNKDPMTSTTQALRTIWQMMEAQQQESNGNSKSTAVTQAIQVLMQTYDQGILQPAIKAMMDLEQAKKHIRTLEQSLASKDRELERLHHSEQQSKKTISNLLKTVETSNEESRDNAQTKLVEAKLRADFLHATMQRNEALQQAEEYKHRADLFKGDLDHYKEKSNKLQNSKAQVERELHSTRSILASMQGTVSNDVDFYKRKLGETNLCLKSSQAVIAKKDREIDRITKERDRLLTQNRLEQLKQAGSISGAGYTVSSNKRARHSY